MSIVLASMVLEIPYPEIDPVFFHIGPLPIRWYALAYITGIVLGWVYAIQLLKRTALWAGPGSFAAGPPMDKEKLDDLIFWVTLGVILGGRIGYVLFYEPNLLIAPWQKVGPIPLPPAIMLWKGGMSFHGGLLGVTLAGYFFSRKHDLRFFSVSDLFAAAAPLGLFFGRLANFINGELYGRPTDAAWAITFPQYFDSDLGQFVYAPDAVPRHPSQLYEAFLEGMVLFAILAIAIWLYKVLRRPGVATGIFLAGYGLSRIIVENFREPDAHMPDFPLGLTMGMMLSMPMVLLGGFLIWRGWTGGLSGSAGGKGSGKPLTRPVETSASATPEDPKEPEKPVPADPDPATPKA